ncbi:hypothetical protein R1sor_024714 [Riccia sorocarpa]|uniref:MI domain-containing protein n=1 Tax=Riccia sorocarpa TaxID=122646 RepID=A0ABD3GS21_9MARC
MEDEGRGRLSRRKIESSPDRNDTRMANEGRNESTGKTDKARKDKETERDAGSEETGAGKRRSKYRDVSCSDEEERFSTRCVADDPNASKGKHGGNEVGTSVHVAALVGEDFTLKLGLSTVSEEEVGMQTGAACSTKQEVHRGGKDKSHAPNDGNREGYRRDRYHNAKDREAGRESECKKVVSKGAARATQDKPVLGKSSEQGEVKKVERASPPLALGEVEFRRAFRRNDKPVLLAAAKFIAHLINQQVAHELLALELLTVLLENPTNDSVEVAVGFVKECGATLQNLSSQGLHAIFEAFRGILIKGEIDKRVQFMIEGLFAVRKANFQGYRAGLPELELVVQEDQITHEFSLKGDLDDESYLDVFKFDPDFVETEKKYEAIKKDILGDESDEAGSDGGDTGKGGEDEEEDERDQRMQIQDETETNLVNLRRMIYLIIMSSLDFEEAGHKLLQLKLEPGQEMEVCFMLLECCCQERMYRRYYGLLGQRFCMINHVYQENFDQCFVKYYYVIHRLETNKLRNAAKFFAHLLGSDALPWQALGYVRLTEEDTTSSSRIFIKILFQELAEHLGPRKLNERLLDPMMQESFDGIFPKDNPKNTRFAINFFTSIGLGGLTDSLDLYLNPLPGLLVEMPRANPSEREDPSSISESDESDLNTESDSDTEPDSTGDSSDSEDRKKRKKRKCL